jgi:hypothetical protein
VKQKKALLFLKKKQQKDFYDPGALPVKSAPSQSHKKVFWLLFFKKVTASFAQHKTIRL